MANLKFQHALRPFVAPALPNAGAEYDQTSTQKTNSVLRLYFNQVDALVSSLVGPTGGSYLSYPYAAVQRTTDKTFTANTATQVTFDQNDYLNGCTNDGTDGIHVKYYGIYNYQYSVQWANTDTQIHAAYVWLRKNGVDVPGTGSRFDVPAKHGTSDGYLRAACNFYIDLAPDDTVELWAAVTNSAVYAEAYAAQTSPFACPAIPSVVATLTYVSTQPAV